MALHSPYCADVPLRNCSLTHPYWYRQWPILLDIGYWVAFLVSF